MDGVQGAALGVKLTRLDRWTAGRRAVADAYHAALAGSGVVRPEPGSDDHVWHVYAVQSDTRDALASRLKDAGVATGFHYPKPVHLQAAYADLGRGEGSFPVSEALARTFLSLPIYPELTGDQIDHIAGVVASHGRPARVAAPLTATG
jgi:dTDP-4-amino-4,6-dideoxygalactose transaminase